MNGITDQVGDPTMQRKPGSWLSGCTYYFCARPGCTLHPDTYGQYGPDGKPLPCACNCHGGAFVPSAAPLSRDTRAREGSDRVVARMCALRLGTVLDPERCPVPTCRVGHPHVYDGRAVAPRV